MSDKTQRALILSQEVARRQLNTLTAHLANGTLSPDAYADKLYDTLLRAHRQACYLGRYRAGDTSPPDADDVRFASDVMRGEDAYLAAFADTLAEGGYRAPDGSLQEHAVLRRAEMYLSRVVGTANEVWALTTPGRIHWKLGEAEHCHNAHGYDCPKLAAGGPYTWQSLPTAPKACETPCIFNCTCLLVSEDGTTSFQA